MIVDWESALMRWQELQATITALTTEERALREQLFAGTFPNPKEGVNSCELPDGSVLKGTYRINRSVNQETVRDLKIDLDTWNKVFKTKIELSVGQYKQLDAKTQKKVDSVLTIKPGLPGLEIVAPKPTPTVVGEPAAQQP